jgi:Uma2 family endonuclease
MSIVMPNQPVSPGAGGEWISYEDFLAQGDADETPTEWVDGKVVPMAPVSDAHDQLTVFLTAILAAYVEAKGAGRAFHEPFSMKTGPSLPGRSPDVMLLRTENFSRIRDNFLEGPADLVIEVISPDSGGRDRGEKYYEYEQGGVGEYWLIDPHRKQAEFYQRGADKIYHSIAPAPDGIYHSVAIPGLWINIEWFWSRPTILAVLKSWRLT